jgi:DHA3 family macrolide efflux protein-like MFS transporter
VFLGFMLLTGVGVSWFSTTATTLLQEQVDPEVQGRVFGLVGIVLAVAMPVGMLIFGPLADTISVEWILVLTGIITVLVTFAVAYRAPTAEAGMITE